MFHNVFYHLNWIVLKENKMNKFNKQSSDNFFLLFQNQTIVFYITKKEMVFLICLILSP